jgi:hypothetical protein
VAHRERQRSSVSQGVDAAIINRDSLEEYKSHVPQIQQRIAYIINLFLSELHVFVRPEIKSLQDLMGKNLHHLSVVHKDSV